MKLPSWSLLLEFLFVVSICLYFFGCLDLCLVQFPREKDCSRGERNQQRNQKQMETTRKENLCWQGRLFDHAMLQLYHQQEDRLRRTGVNLLNQKLMKFTHMSIPNLSIFLPIFQQGWNLPFRCYYFSYCRGQQSWPHVRHLIPCKDKLFKTTFSRKRPLSALWIVSPFALPIRVAIAATFTESTNDVN